MVMQYDESFYKRASALNNFVFWTKSDSGYALTFTPSEPFIAHHAGNDQGEGLPPGYLVEAMPERGLFKQPLDSIKLEKALRSGFLAMGLRDPDIRRTQHGVWVNAGTIDRMPAVIDKRESETKEYAPSAAYGDFSRAFRAVVIGGKMRNR